jgi:hypothetical protein
MNKMTKFFYVPFIAFVLLFSLSGCGPIYNTTYSYVTPKSWDGRQCANQCLQMQTNCNMQCNNQYQNCVNSARLAATPQYLGYLNKKENENKTPHRSLDDFTDTSSCSQDCSSCTDTYNQCFSNCGGRVITQRQCVMFCH